MQTHGVLFGRGRVRGAACELYVRWRSGHHSNAWSALQASVPLQCPPGLSAHTGACRQRTGRAGMGAPEQRMWLCSIGRHLSCIHSWTRRKVQSVGRGQPPELDMLVDLQAPGQILYRAGMEVAVCIHITVYIHPVYCYCQIYSATVRSFCYLLVASTP